VTSCCTHGLGVGHVARDAAAARTSEMRSGPGQDIQPALTCRDLLYLKNAERAWTSLTLNYPFQG